jgi:hypothetical protein
MPAVASPAQLQERRRRAEDRYVQGVSIAEIAAELGVSQNVVANDLRCIRIAWTLERASEGDARLELELRKIDRLEREAWRAWVRSQQDLDSTKVSRDGAKEKAERTLRKQSGDPRFLVVVKDCVDRRCRLLGLSATTQKRNAGEHPLPAIEVVVRDADELERLWSVDDLLERLGREQEASKEDPVQTLMNSLAAGAETPDADGRDPDQEAAA